MKKKIHLLWFATLVVAFCGLVFSASAQQDYGFKIAGKSINSDNYKNLTTIPGVTIKPGGYIVYDPSSNTLRMKDANISINQTEESSLEFTTSLSIPLFILKIEGSNELNAQLEANENLHITGPGKLRIIEKEDYPALVIKKGKILRIDGGCSVIASGSSGITDLDSTGKLIIDGANVTGLGKEEKNSSDGYGIGNFKSIEIKNAQIITPQGGYIGKASNYKIESDYILGVDNKPALEVQIRVKVPTVSVILKTSKGGKATISGAKDLKAVPKGTKLSVMVTPDKGHQLEKILAGKEDITKTKSFTVKENTTVIVTFKKEQPKVETYKVILDTKTGGKASITGAKDLKAVPKGTKLSVTATPDKGYQLDKILAGKEDITKTKSFTVKENTTVIVSFKKMEEPKVETFNVTLDLKEGGKASITGAKDLKAVPKGTKLSVTATPDKGYQLDKILAGKEDITKTKSFTVKENTTVIVSFKKMEEPKVETFNVTLDLKEGGKASITGAKDLKAVPKGTKLSVTATPDKGYQLDKILAGKEDITKTKSFTVKENTTVTVSFKKMEEPKVETFNVTLETEGEGKAFITGAKDLKVVPKGTKLSVTVIPNKGYRLDKILAGKEDITETKSFTVKENTVVTVSFKKDTGVGQVLIDNTIIFPNPAKETVTIRNAVANTDIVLYATNGMQVLSSNTDNSGYAQIDVTSLAAGSYVIRIGMITKHLVIAQ